MPRAKLRNWMFLVCLPVSVGAQAQFTLDQEDLGEASQGAVVTSKGISAFDLIPLHDNKLSFALRYGHVLKGTEVVELDGRRLEAGTDYAIDHISGTIYVRTQYREGQTLRVRYRYDDKAKQVGSYGISDVDASALKFAFAPGATAVLGLGLTERRADGTILQSNVFGMTNDLKITGNGKLRGLFMFSNREKSETMDMFGNSGSASAEESKGSAIIQEFETKAGDKGTIKASYQDIEDKFTGFSSFASAGYSEKEIQTLEKEKGLKRTSFSLTDFSTGRFNFGTGFDTVGDANGSITWRSASFGFDKARLTFSSQYVDEGFSRFESIREEDRKQLAKEKGLLREVMNLDAPFNYGKFGFSNLMVESNDGSGIYRRTFNLETSWLQGNFLTQHVDEEFNRFNDLREQDHKQLAKEQGLSRQELNLASNFSGLKLSYFDSSISGEEGSMAASDIGVNGKNFSISHSRRGVGEEFHSLRSLHGGDVDRYVGGILGMYSGDHKVTNKDKNDFYSLNGFERDAWAFNYKPWAGYNLNFNSVAISGPSGNLDVNDISLDAKNTQIHYREQLSDDEFSDSNRLLDTEQKILGTVDGLDRRDFSFLSSFGSKKLAFSLLDAQVGELGAHRERFSFNDKGFDLSYTKRAVDENFTDVGRLVDPEREHLANFLGFDETEVKGSWNVMRGLSLNYHQSDAISSIFDQERNFRAINGKWDLSARTSLNIAKVDQKFVDENAEKIDQSFEHINLTHNAGANTKIALTHETQQFNGEEDLLPDAIRNAIAFTQRLSSSTTISTEQSETRFENGEREYTSQNTISTALTPRMGISVTDTRVKRDGDKPDETHRDYGFWVDFGSGIRLEYGYKRDMRGDDYGKLDTQTTLSGGTAGGLKIGGGNYKHTRIDGQRETHLGNFSLSNAKPFKWGSITDINFYYDTNTNRDYSAWKREDLKFGANAAWNNIGFGYEYLSQISPNGMRAIDRVFSLTTDKSGKAPFVGVFKYGVRTMPDDENVMIRDYSIKYQASKNLNIVHALVTNPTQNKNNALLGSTPIDERRNTWTINYQNDPSTKFDLSWSEIKRESQNESLRREARFNMTLFANNPSPLQLSYAMQEWDRHGNAYLSHSFGLSFVQRPGPNQSLSFSLENFHYGAGKPADSALHNWGMRLDYNVRF